MTNDDIIKYIENDEKATMEAFSRMILSKKSEVKMKDLNILKTGYIKGFRHIFHNIKQFFKNCKYAWQRATKGYSDYDIQYLDRFYSSVISTSMQQFAEESNSDPGYMSYDKWICKIKEISNKIRKCNDLYDEYIYTDINKLSNRNFYTEHKEAKKITAEGYKELGEIIDNLCL